MRLFAVLLGLLLCVQSLASEAPRPAKIVPLATQAVFLDIALNGSSVIAVGERGIIVRSDDQGGTWRQVPSPVDVTLTALTFVNTNVGWAVGHESTIIKTLDGGEHWQVVRYKPEEERFYLNVVFDNEEDGTVLGTDGELWTTADAGETWSLEVLAVEEWFQNHLFAFHQLDNGSAVIAAERGGVFARSAGEMDWQVVESPYPGTFFGVTELADGFLLYGMSGKVYLLNVAAAASDSHQWREIITNTDQFLLAATINSGQHALLVGRGGIVLEIDSDGKLIREQQRPNRIDITAIASDNSHVYLASMKGGIEQLRVDELFAPNNITANK